MDNLREEAAGYIALDVGSTHVKSIYVGTEALTVSGIEVAQSPPALTFAQESRHETCAEQLLSLCKNMLDKALYLYPNAKGILLSAQMHGFIITGKSEKALCGYVSWQDTASKEVAGGAETYLDLLRKRIFPNTWARTGMPLKSKLAIGNLYSRIRGGMALHSGDSFHTLGSFILRKLTGETACHITEAAATGFCAAEGGWLEDIQKAALCGTLDFPPIKYGYAAAGVYLLNGKDYPVYPAIGDHQVCLLGSMAEDVSDVNINIGTGGVIGQIIPSFEASARECRPFIDGRYVRTVTGLPGGKQIQDLADRLCARNGITQNRAWEQLTDATLSDAEISNFYKDFALHYAREICAMPGVKRIAYSGGAAERNPALRISLERECGLPARPVRGEAVGRGSLLLALLASGKVASLNDASSAVEQVESVNG